ncbi:MAG: PilZ domain-containing protein [Acidobacteriales bacterium]|nr:PilZ domain-containing protein [Terriglobales bacterium]
MTLDRTNKRRIPRFLITEDARALDSNGSEIGRVSQLSGTGVLVQCSSEIVAEHLVSRGETCIVLVEPRTQATRPIPVVVRYREGRSIGFEFQA